MAVNLPPTGGGNQIFIDVIFRTFTEGLRQAGQAVRQAGTEPFTQFGRAQEAAARGQERLQQSFRASMENLRAWEALVGRSERTLGAFVSTTERFVRGRGLQLAPEQEMLFQNQRQQLQLMRESAGAFRDETREITAGAAARARLAQQLEGIQRLRTTGVPREVIDPMEERLLRRGLAAGVVGDPQQARARLQEIQATRESAAAFRDETREITANAAARARFVERLAGVQRLRAAGVPTAVVDPMEQRVLRGGVERGFATQEQVARLRQLQDESRKAGLGFRFLGEEIPLGRTVAWAAAFSLVYTAIRLVTLFISEVTIGAIRRLADFQELQISLAAELVNIQPGLPFAQAERTAGALARRLQELQPGFIGTQQQLEEVLGATIRSFRGIDLETARGRDAFLGFANAVVISQRGIARAGSTFREVIAIFEGVNRVGAQFRTLLVQQDPELDRTVRRFRQLGDSVRLMEEIIKLVPGFAQVGARALETLPGQFRTVTANINIILRQVAEPFGPFIQGSLRAVNSLLQIEIGGRRLAATLVTILTPFGLVSEAALRIRRTLQGPEAAQFEATQERAAAAAKAAAIVADFLSNSLEGLQVRLQAGQITTEEFGQGLRQLADDLESTAGSSAEARQEYLRLITAIIQFRAEQERLSREFQRYLSFQVPLAESQRRIVRDPRFLTEEVEIRQQLLTVELALADARRRQASEPRIEARRQAVREEQDILNQQAQLQRRLIDLAQERARIVAEASAVVLRAARDELNARLLELNLAEREQLIRAGGAAQESAIRARFAAERRRAVEDEVRQRLDQLLGLRDAALRAEAEMARARGEVIRAPAEAARTASDFQISFLQQAPTDETLSQMRDRFQRMRELQEGAIRGQIDAAREELRITPRTLEAAPRRLEILSRLRDLLIQQAQAQFQLNQQERDALRIARDRNLDEDVRILERRLNTLVRIGAPTARIADVERQLGRARQTQELRRFTRRELEEEQVDIGLRLRAPDITAQERTGLLERLSLIRDVASQQAEEQQRGMQANERTIQEIGAIGRDVQSVLRQIADDTENAVKRARLEYERFFKWLESRLPQIVNLFQSIGDAAGRKFAEAALAHIRAVFPRPGEGVLAPAPEPGRPGAPRAPGPRGELPAPAPFLGGIGGAVPAERLPAPTGFGGPINVNLTSSGPPQAPVIMIGNVDITDRVSQATIDEMVAAVLGPSGDAGVRRDRRQIPDGAVA